jgi:hypothetical protein
LVTGTSKRNLVFFILALISINYGKDFFFS